MATWITLNDELDDIYNDWDAPATPIAQPITQPIAQPVQPVIDPNGWHWYPDSNGQLCTIYLETHGNECMMWQLQDDGSFYWRCAGVGYTCREIGFEDRRGIYFQDIFVGTMILDEDLTVTWLPETYINQHIDIIYDNIHNINNINNNNNDNINNNNNDNINNINDNIYDDIYDVDESDDNNDP